MKSTFLMEQQHDYLKEIADIRSMIERTTKFLSLAGWAGIMAGVYALAGAWIAYSVFDFNEAGFMHASYSGKTGMRNTTGILVLATVIILLTIVTAAYLSHRKAVKKNERVWNATSRRLLVNMFVPLAAGGLLILVLISKDLILLAAPLTLIFYGLSLYIASRFTFEDIRILGLANIILGLIAAYFLNYSLLCWALGFGVGHIVYGIYVHVKYEK